VTTYIKSELAWSLVDYCRPALSRAERDLVFVTLGAGDYDDVIDAALRAIDRSSLMVPEELQERVAAWMSYNPIDLGREGISPRLVALRSVPTGRTSQLRSRRNPRPVTRIPNR
jgi:hypothetical protein